MGAFSLIVVINLLNRYNVINRAVLPRPEEMHWALFFIVYNFLVSECSSEPLTSGLKPFGNLMRVDAYGRPGAFFEFGWKEQFPDFPFVGTLIYLVQRVHQSRMECLIMLNSHEF